MFDEEVDRYDTYEDYLDSLVSEEDHFYLEDEEMARIIAELGYRFEFDCRAVWLVDASIPVFCTSWIIIALYHLISDLQETLSPGRTSTR